VGPSKALRALSAPTTLTLDLYEKYTITILLLMVISTFVSADFTDMYGTYESITHSQLYGNNKNLTPEQKEYFEKIRLSLTINENEVILVLGGNSEESLKLNYYIIKKNIILAYYGDRLNKVYHPIYFENNIIYTMGQRFEKK